MDIIKKSERYVKKLLAPLEWLDYHRYNHTQEVYNRAKYLASKEWITWEDLEILELACLFHDTGFIVSYDDNELFWAKIAQNFLIGYNYSNKKISKIRELIIATTHSYMTPLNLSEMIIKDADMDNLGRDDFLEKMQHIKTERELAEWSSILDLEWKKRCLKMLKNYEYFTQTQKNERNETKQKNTHNLQSLSQ